MINILIAIGIGIFGAFWRRWYGGADFFTKPWLSSRGVQTTTALIVSYVLGLMTVQNWNWLRFPGADYLMPAALSLVWVFLVWSRGHGSYFDLGRGDEQDDEVVRYTFRWMFKPKHYGSYLYDLTGMIFRYTYYLCFVCLIIGNFSLWPAGLAVALVYSAAWEIKDKSPWFYEKMPASAQRPTNIGEYAGGFILWGSLAYNLL